MNIPADLIPPWLYRVFAATTALALVIVPVLVDNGVITARLGAIIGAVVAAFAGGGHTTSLVAGRAMVRVKQAAAAGPQSGAVKVSALTVVLLAIASWFAVIGLRDLAGYLIALGLCAVIMVIAVSGIGRGRAREAANRAAVAAQLERLRRDLGQPGGQH